PFEVIVQPDLLGGHRLALGHDHPPARRQSAAGVPAQLTDDVARLGRVLGEMYRAPGCRQALRELVEQLWQALEVCLAAAFQLGSALREVEAFERGVATAAEAGHGADQRFL